MKCILFGATGMVGMGVLIECLEDDFIDEVLVVNRNPCGRSHPKLREIIHRNFFDFSSIESELTPKLPSPPTTDGSSPLPGFDACFFCLGVSSIGMNEMEYKRLTHDLTLLAAQTLLRLNPAMVFCFVSGQGTDSSEEGGLMWARVKGMTENALQRLPFRASYMFRPGYIHPRKGVTSRTRLYRILYVVLTPLYPLLRLFFAKRITTTVKLGRAMINAARDGYSSPILEVPDINRIADRTHLSSSAS